MSDAETLLQSVLREAPLPWPENSQSELTKQFIDLAQFHGVIALVNHLLHSIASPQPWPDEVLAIFKKAAIHQTAWEIAHQRELSRVIKEFSDAEIVPLVLKGSALAYSKYPNPALRSRCDTDLLISREKRDSAERLLAKLEFTKQYGVAGEVISYEHAFSKTDGFGFTHTIDLHWQVNNAQVFARLFRFEDLLKRSVSLPELDERAIGLSQFDALLLACLHRAAHLEHLSNIGGKDHLQGNRLIWLYDIHLMLSGISRDELAVFADRAHDIGLGKVCLDALDTCRTALGTQLPESIAERLREPSTDSAASRYLHAGKFERLWINFLAYPDWKTRLKYLKELFFPSAEYMRHKYRDQTGTPLFWLYLKRAWFGVGKRLPSKSG